VIGILKLKWFYAHLVRLYLKKFLQKLAGLPVFYGGSNKSSLPPPSSSNGWTLDNTFKFFIVPATSLVNKNMKYDKIEYIIRWFMFIHHTGLQVVQLRSGNTVKRPKFGNGT
jgi:hypothetical protein